jgi:hypothetical protein
MMPKSWWRSAADARTHSRRDGWRKQQGDEPFDAVHHAVGVDRRHAAEHHHQDVEQIAPIAISKLRPAGVLNPEDDVAEPAAPAAGGLRTQPRLLLGSGVVTGA